MSTRRKIIAWAAIAGVVIAMAAGVITASKIAARAREANAVRIAALIRPGMKWDVLQALLPPYYDSWQETLQKKWRAFSSKQSRGTDLLGLPSTGTIGGRGVIRNFPVEANASIIVPCDLQGNVIGPARFEKN